LGLKLGIEDPEQWLEDCPDRVFDNWYAFYQLEPFGGETALLTRLVAMLFISCMRQGVKLEELNSISDDFMKMLMPSDWYVEDDKPELDVDAIKDNLAKMSAALAKAFQ